MANIDYLLSDINNINGIGSKTAKLLRISDELGSLEEGKIADIVAVEGNPLEDISVMENVVFVMKEGIIYKDITE